MKSLKYHPGFLVCLVFVFLCLKSLEKLYLKGIFFSAFNLVLGNHVGEQPSWPLGKNKFKEDLIKNKLRISAVSVFSPLPYVYILFACAGQDVSVGRPSSILLNSCSRKPAYPCCPHPHLHSNFPALRKVQDRGYVFT